MISNYEIAASHKVLLAMTHQYVFSKLSEHDITSAVEKKDAPFRVRLSF